MPEPRGGEGNGFHGLPTWVRSIALVGVPSAIALYLVYVLASFATVGLADLNRQMDAHADAMIRHDADAKGQLEALTRVLLRICINTAQSPEDRQRCLGDR